VEHREEFLMKTRSIVVGDVDMDRLHRLLRALRNSPFRDQKQLEALDQILENANVTASYRIPPRVVRIKSRIRVLDLDTQKTVVYTLVFPESADISKGRISVLAPVGMALLGHKQGDVVEADVPGGIRRLRIEVAWFEREEGTERAICSRPGPRLEHPHLGHKPRRAA
jgi:regulator of nucleoside diphosphate kinase